MGVEEVIGGMKGHVLDSTFGTQGAEYSCKG